MEAIIAAILAIAAGLGIFIKKKKKKDDPEPAPAPAPSPDPDPVPPPPGPSPPAHPEIVAEVTGQSCMSIARLTNGQVLIGTYSFPESQALLYCLGIPDPVAEIPCGESIIRITEYDGIVFLSCEYQTIWKALMQNNPADYRDANGISIFDKYLTLAAGWQKGAFDFQKVRGKYYALGGGEVWFDGRTRKFWGKDYYLKRLFDAGNAVWAIGYNLKADRGGWLESSDGTNWAWAPVGEKGNRFMAADWDPNTMARIWLGGTANYLGGDHHRNSAAVWMFTPATRRLDLLNVFPGFDYCQSIYHKPGTGDVYIGLTRGWKSRNPGAQLVRMSASGFDPFIPAFGEAEIRGILPDGENHLLICTRTDRVRGRVYRVRG